VIGVCVGLLFAVNGTIADYYDYIPGALPCRALLLPLSLRCSLPDVRYVYITLLLLFTFVVVLIVSSFLPLFSTYLVIVFCWRLFHCYCH